MTLSPAKTKLEKIKVKRFSKTHASLSVSALVSGRPCRQYTREISMSQKQPTLKYHEITDKILHAFFKEVYHKLGYGFLEKVYMNAMTAELRRAGLKVGKQAKIDVFFKGEIVGEYFADLLVENAVIVELKAKRCLMEEDDAQLLNYLRATPFEVGLLLNFGAKPDFCRLVFDNDRKPSITWK
jgi:GxxExxY protein